MRRIANLIHNLKEKLIKGEEWDKFREDKDIVVMSSFD